MNLKLNISLAPNIRQHPYSKMPLFPPQGTQWLSESVILPRVMCHQELANQLKKKMFSDTNINEHAIFVCFSKYRRNDEMLHFNIWPRVNE